MAPAHRALLSSWRDEGRVLLRCLTVVYFKGNVFGELKVIRSLCVLVEQVAGGLSFLLLCQHLSDTFLPQSVCHPG